MSVLQYSNITTAAPVLAQAYFTLALCLIPQLGKGKKKGAGLQAPTPDTRHKTR